MRLELRVLLAYLNQTLEVGPAKVLASKIEQSAAARRVIKRIQEVISRRDLTIPLSHDPGQAVDPNTIAEFLDGVLSPERSTEIEEICLASNRYLAEAAACHQILGLTRRESASPVRPVYQRMYSLVKETPRAELSQGLESGAKPAKGLISRRRLLAGAAGAVILLVAMVAGVYYFGGFRPYPGGEEISSALNDRGETPPLSSGRSRSRLAPQEGEKPVVKPKPQSPAKPPAVASEKKELPAIGRILPAKGFSGLTLQRHDESQAWRVLPPESPAFPGDRLLSLPGFSTEVELKTGIRLRLLGNVPDGSMLLESAVALQDSPGFALDITQLCGRAMLSNPKPGARVRLRFLEEIWELELTEPDSQVAMELWSVYPPGFTFDKTRPMEEPMAGLNLFVLKGHARLKVRYDLHELEGPCLFIWNNIGAIPRQARPLKQAPGWTGFPPTLPEEVRETLEDLRKSLEGKDAVESFLVETLHDADHFKRVLGIFALGAIDALTPLLEVWEDAKQPAGIRLSVTAALRHWMARNAGQGMRLYEALEKRYSPETAESLLTLLHGFSEKQAGDPATYQSLIDWLRHPLLPVRELAFFQLFALAPQGRRIPYDPAGDQAQRDRAFREWKKLIPEGQLPPFKEKSGVSQPIPSP